jgi:hypothetical protein
VVVAPPGEDLADALCVKTVPRASTPSIDPRPTTERRSGSPAVSGLGLAGSAGPGCIVLVIFGAVGRVESNACLASGDFAHRDSTLLLTDCLR